MSISSNRKQIGYKTRQIVIIVFLLLIQTALISTLIYRQVKGEPDYPLKLTIASLPLEQVQSKISPYGPGFEKELVQKLSDNQNLEPEWLFYEDWETCLQAFKEGKADLMIAPGFNAPDLQNRNIQAGPDYEQHSALLLHYKLRFGLREKKELCQHDILKIKHPRLEKKLQKKTDKLGCEPILEPLDSFRLNLVLNFLEMNQARFALVDSGNFRFWEPFFTELRKAHAFSATIHYRWYWNKNNRRLHKKIQDFWHDLQDSKQFKQIRELYWGFFPEKTDYYQLNHLQDVLKNRLPRYKQTILEAAEENNIDPLLLIAVIYQESAFMPGAKSKTGVRGLLQLTQNTAQELGVQNRLDPQESILGGARYLRKLWERLEPLQVQGWDRWFMALGAYNQGLNHLHNAQKLAEQKNLDSSFWFNLKTIYPKLGQKEYYTQDPYQPARGHEAVDFVQKVRYYYYVLHGLSVLSGSEADQLTPFLGQRPVDWPG